MCLLFIVYYSRRWWIQSKFDATHTLFFSCIYLGRPSGKRTYLTLRCTFLHHTRIIKNHIKHKSQNTKHQKKKGTGLHPYKNVLGETIVLSDMSKIGKSSWDVSVYRFNRLWPTMSLVGPRCKITRSSSFQVSQSEGVGLCIRLLLTRTSANRIERQEQQSIYNIHQM